MNKIFRVFLVCRKHNKNEYDFIYGHGIEWELTGLDYINREWKTHKINSMFKVCFRDYESSSEFIAEAGNGYIHIDKKIITSIPAHETEEFFLDKDFSKEYEFNPFISLCADAKYWLHPEEPELKDIEEALLHVSSLGKIKERFNIDLKRYPYLLFTFGFYFPVRIEESFDYHREKVKNNCSIQFNDFFENYQGSEVVVIVGNDDKYKRECFLLDNEKHWFTCHFDPDYIDITITRNGRVVYKNKSFFVKKVHVQMDIQAGPDIISGDKRVKRYLRDDIIVGDGK
ncbi:hypothetical protein [Halomonas piscis]|uniref:hypothetical protein n=1 Tax=Halomonas piscis TaxID=3031727 RepID=UPI00289C5613|nr:hypothetical protein [Halomonas piscis]